METTKISIEDLRALIAKLPTYSKETPCLWNNGLLVEHEPFSPDYIVIKPITRTLVYSASASELAIIIADFI